MTSRALIFLLLLLCPMLMGPKYFVSGPKTVSVGDTFVIYVMLDLQDLFYSIAQSVSFQYDTKRLEYLSGQELGVPPYAFNLTAGINGGSGLSDVVGECESATFGLAYSQSPFAVCLLEFRALSPGKAKYSPYFDFRDGLLGQDPGYVSDVELRGSSVQVKK